MRILTIVTRREFRGAEVVARDLGRALQARGHEVGYAGLFAPVDAHEADTLTAGLTAHWDLGGPKTRGVQWSVLRRLRTVVREFAPDVVHANAFNALKYAALLKFVDRARWPLVYRNVGISSQWVTRRGQRLWGRFLLRQVDHVLSVSQASLDDFRRTYGVPANRISIAWQGVEIPSPADIPSARQRLKAVLDVDENAPVLVHVGNFSPEKNHAGLLEAFGVVHRRHQTCRLALIGDGPLRPEIERRAADASYADRVSFFGTRPDAARLAIGADLMLLSSTVEGIPGVVLEASAGGVPTVAPRVGGLPEIVIPDRTGVLVLAGDMLGLGTAAADLIDDTPRRQALGATARQFVAERHSMGASVDQHERLYESLMGTKSELHASAVTSQEPS